MTRRILGSGGQAHQSGAPTPQLVTRTEIGGVELLERISDETRRLCEEVQVSEPFYLPNWREAYLRSFPSKGQLVLVTVWDHERLCGFLPLVLTSGWMSGLPARILAACANTHGGRYDLVCCNGAARGAVLQAMWDELTRLRKWDVLEVSYVKEGSGIDELLQVAAKGGYSTARKFAWRALYATFQKQTDGTDPWLAGTQRKFRANLRRTYKQINELGKVSFEHFDSADPEMLEAFFKLEASGWKGREGTAIACQPETRRFYELIASRAALDGYFSLDFLKLDGKPISGHFAMVWNGRYQLLKAAYDESYRRFGPGHLIVWELLQKLGPSGLTELDFIAPATWDESCWASESRMHYTHFVFSKSIYGKLLHFFRIRGRTIIKSLIGRPTQNEVHADLK